MSSDWRLVRVISQAQSWLCNHGVQAGRCSHELCRARFQSVLLQTADTLYGHLPRCSSCGAHDENTHANQCTNARRLLPEEHSHGSSLAKCYCRNYDPKAPQPPYVCGICGNTYEACDCARTGRR